MRFLRALFHNLLNNEQIINKLADSKPIRRSAQFVVHILIRAGMMNGTHRISLNPQEFVKQLRNIAQRLRQQLEESKNELKKNPPK